jgi:thiol-disulfide isomerase/thioredoxin
VSGRLHDSGSDGTLTWQSDSFARPLQFELRRVHSVQFPLPARRPDQAGPYCFELAGGDTVAGQLVSLDQHQAVLEIPGLGKLHVDRAALLRFYRASAADLIFAGPQGLEGWRQTVVGQVGEASGAWTDDRGQPQTDRPGARIHRHFRPPPLVRYEFELGWSAKPDFELAVGLNENADRAAFRIETWDGDLVVTCEREKQADLAVLRKIGEGAGQVRLLVLFDQPRGHLLVYSSAGEKLADLSASEEKSAAPPRMTKARPGMLLRAPTSKPELPGGLQLTHRRGGLKLQQLSIHRWSGIAPRPATAGQASLHLTDGTIRSATVQSFDRAQRRLVFSEGGQEQTLDERHLHDVVLAQPEAQPAARTVRVLSMSGARLSGELASIRERGITLRCPGISEPIELPMTDLQAIVVTGESIAGTSAASTSASAADETPAAPPVGEARLELTAASLRGRLVDAVGGDGSCLVFQPQVSTTASPLAAGVSGRLVFREAPPQAPSPTAGTQQSPALQIVNGMRTMLGVRQTPALRPAPPGDCRLHLRTGDTLTCQVQFIDERGVTIQSAVTDATFVPHERIKALELRLDTRPVKIEKTKFERLLTLPRMQRDNPPEQLVRSLEGDYLRGRLVAMNDKELKLELRLENKTIDRSQVTRILWLHPDEAAKATLARPPQEDAAPPPAGTRVQAVPRTGNRLTFFAAELSGQTLLGHSEVLGACRVDLTKIDQLLIGGAIEAAASSLAFHQWKLRPAAEPLPDPEPGAEGAGGEGLESVLVGKDAPPIDLELLDGSSFRLADRRGKTVVLDFWASWCGPCLQTMPQVDQVAREFAERGVQLVAINLEETPERIKAALDRLKLETVVALDKDGRVAERYGATSIPQTVIIDREGKVARLFVGGSARFDEQLRQALRAVLDAPANTALP